VLIVSSHLASNIRCFILAANHASLNVENGKGDHARSVTQLKKTTKERLTVSITRDELHCVVSDLTKQCNDLEAQKNGAYSERNKLVAALTKIYEFESSIEDHVMAEGQEWDDEWRKVVYINLPSGQASWHIHVSEEPMFAHLQSKGTKWDGHTTEEKYERVAAIDVTAKKYGGCFLCGDSR
jgi:hypothetical protein